MTVLTDLDQAARHAGEFRAGGTDLMARRPAGPYVDLRGLPGLSGLTWRPDGSVRIGALTTVAELAGDVRLRADHPALALTAQALATPQIRAVATVGGNLLQRNRCWYYRNPAFSCHQNGGDSCPARAGLTLYSAVIDTGPCVAPHPSSLAMALLACEASVEVHGRGPSPVGDLYGDGSDPARDHLLGPGEVLVAIDLPPPVPGERAAYHRAIGRSEAEWPLVEAVARLAQDGGGIARAAVAVGGVARTPLRLPEVEEALLAGEPLDRAAARAAARCTPTAQNGYKVALLTGTVLEVLERAAGAAEGGS
ncbi:FAD binding domain-containing protein [Streptosporangium roseum]|uniref:Oxidoreductase, FAD-binding subunit n=1 Tax=Streptosporangium roseum (strain ATCC 12428 / DSM 43021 / JCM 3005 / KCTC 9067 / NCIMB 10171 / NRRL 2505 / NI 9100) TaxID=479432 RepID=D2AR32_STRRD|nr:FAD binding domain-containing protein [Streptosporangium roseum]ACZ88373.1 oxidoreductase, FAD-binding subunit [Streptosporangium roseum DSM 43021]